MREIALDTETTGLDPRAGHRIVEIGCVEMINRVATGKVYHQYINPERDMPAEAEAIHGLSESFLSTHPVFEKTTDDFLEFIGSSQLVIHNAEFDMRFINAELALLEREPIPMERTTDTVRMARRKFPGAPANLDALCRRFNIDNSNRELHGALLDARLLADVYLELTGGRQTDLGLATAGAMTASGDDGATRTQREARVFAPSAEEEAAHAAFLDTLTNPIWRT
ncbi:MAG: DNA polymerase III subunit epsilon [Rhodospirillaceae bacterium]|nr:DNA polymerase III subunit epsilon [Rhodospirillaceae bacterium]MCK5546172.1 DNA polymerase III subunit epsilon [Rhodospirillaceae bacterium]